MRQYWDAKNVDSPLTDIEITRTIGISLLNNIVSIIRHSRVRVTDQKGLAFQGVNFGISGFLVDGRLVLWLGPGSRASRSCGS